MKKVLIVGYGYVGKAMAEFFRKKYKVYVYDPGIAHYEFPDKVNFLKVDDLNEKEVDMAVICVPTPMNDDGSCDASRVAQTLMKLKTELVLVKSTVPPGTMITLKKFFKNKLVFSPEFIGESSYWSSYSFDREVVETPWFIFGGDKKDCSEVIDYFLPITGPEKEYRITDYRTAELVKYVENVFGALKVTFCNEMYDVCQAFKVDYNELRDLWLLDPRVNKMHTAVFKDKRGFGGKCFPKDINGLVQASARQGYTPELLMKVIECNKNFISKNK